MFNILGWRNREPWETSMLCWGTFYTKTRSPGISTGLLWRPPNVHIFGSNPHLLLIHLQSFCLEFPVFCWTFKFYVSLWETLGLYIWLYVCVFLSDLCGCMLGTWLSSVWYCVQFSGYSYCLDFVNGCMSGLWLAVWLYVSLCVFQTWVFRLHREWWRHQTRRSWKHCETWVRTSLWRHGF